MNLKDENKFEKLKIAHEEEASKSNDMTDEFPEDLDSFLRNSKF